MLLNYGFPLIMYILYVCIYLFIYLNNREYIINAAIWWFSKDQLSKTALHYALPVNTTFLFLQSNFKLPAE